MTTETDRKPGGWGGFLVFAVVAAVLAAFVAPAFVGRVYAYDDLGTFHIPLRWFYAGCLAAGSAFDWCPAMFGGFHLQGEGQVGMTHPLHLALYGLLPLPAAFMIEVALPYPVALAGMYRLLRRWDLGHDASIAGAILFAFSGCLFTRCVHPNVSWGLAHLPWLLWAIDAGASGEARALPLYGLITASQALVSHPQFLWISLVGEVIYGSILAAPRGVPWRRVARLAAAKGLGELAAAVQLLPTLDLIAGSRRQVRVEGLAFDSPRYLAHLTAWLAPYHFPGRLYNMPGIGFVSHEANLYLGAVPPVLMAWLLAGRREIEGRGKVRGLALMAGLALLMVYLDATPLIRLYTKIPVIGLFRINARNYVLFALAIAGLSAIAVADLARAPASGRPWRSLWPLAIPPALAMGLTAVLWAMARLRPMHLASPAAALAGVGLSCAAAALAAGAARGRRGALAALVAFAAADLGAYGLSFVWSGPMPTVAGLVATSPAPPSHDGFRVRILHGDGTPLASNLPIMDGRWLVHGYASLAPVRRLDYETIEAQRVIGSGGSLYVPDDYEHGSGSESGDSRWVATPDPMPRARLVAQARVSDDPGRAILGLDVARVALVDRPIELTPGEPGEARVVRDRPGNIGVEVDAPGRRLLVVAETDRGGWRARVDGRDEPTVRVYGDLLGCVVPPGRHEVALNFRPRSLAAGRALTIASTAGLVAWLILATRRGRRVATG